MKRLRRFKKQKELINASIDKVVKRGLKPDNIKMAEALLRLHRVPVNLSSMSAGQIMSKYKVKYSDVKELRSV